MQVFFNFTFEKTPTTTVIESYKNTKQGYKTVILANEFSNESIKLEKDLNSKIKLCSLTDVYLSLKKAELLPEITLPKNVIKINKTTRLKGIFTKANSKKALLFGVVILLSSKLTFYPIYYIIFGSLLVILALTLRFYGKVTQAPPVGIENL